MIEPDSLLPHDRQHVLAGHDGAAQVDGDTRSKAASVISDGFASPPARLTPTLLCRISTRPQRLHGLVDGRLERRFLGDVGLEGDALAALSGHHRRRLLGRGEIHVDGQHLGALAREHQRRGAAVAHALAGPLAGADDDGDLVC